MGKGARLRTTERRLKKKQSRREANRLKYRQWADEGRNSKTKRALRAGSKKAKLKIFNPAAKNIGDIRFYPKLNLPFLAKMLLLKWAGLPHQWQSRHSTVQVREYIVRNNLGTPPAIRPQVL